MALSNCFVLTRDGMLISGGSVDNGLRFRPLASTSDQPLFNVICHREVITCLARSGTALVSGSDDATLIVWDVTPVSASRPLFPILVRRICTHNAGVACVDVNVESDIVASSDKDGDFAIHSLRTGKFRFGLSGFRGVPKLIRITSEGHIAVACLSAFLYVYSYNGKQLSCVQLREHIFDMKVTANGKYLITGGTSCAVVIYSLPLLQNVFELKCDAPVESLSLEFDDSLIFAGLSSGRLAAFRFNPLYWSPSVQPADDFVMIEE